VELKKVEEITYLKEADPAVMKDDYRRCDNDIE